MAGVTEPSYYDYLLTTQQFLADTDQKYVNPEDLRSYINRARREVAMRTQSIRILTPVSGEITSIEVTRPGRRYRHPRVRVSWPDMPTGEQPHPGGRRARAIAQQVDGRITNISLTDGGSGYFRPRVRIWDAEREDEPDWPDHDRSDDGWPDDWDDEGAGQWRRWPVPPNLPFEDNPHVPPREWPRGFRADRDDDDRDDEHERRGHGARARAHIVPILKTEGFQEVYPFKAVPLERFPGVAEIFAVKSISFIYANYRYSIPVFSFSVYQAYVRIYPQQYLYVPTAAAQFGQGVNGSLYMYPIPSHMYQMEWDVFCLPQDMADDQDFEAIPKPWTDAVPYFAAHLAYLGLQNHNAAQYYLNLYDDMVRRYSAYARPGRAINPYGRWAAFT